MSTPSQTSSSSKTKVKTSNSDTTGSFVRAQMSAVAFRIDSLKQSLAKAKEDTTKINLLRQIGGTYHLSKESLAYLQQALELSQKTKNAKLEAFCYNDIGIVQDNLANYPLAIYNYLKSLRIDDSLGNENSKDYAANLNNIGIFYWRQGEYEPALNYLLRSIRIYESLGMDISKVYAGSLNNIGNVYMNQGESQLDKVIQREKYKSALDYYLRSINIYESLGMENSKLYAMSLNNIGVVYYYQNKKDSVLYYFIKSLKIRKKIEDKAGVVIGLNNIGELYTELASVQKTSADKQDMYIQALAYLLNGYALSKTIGDKYMVMLTSENLARTHAQVNKYKDAYEYHQIFVTYQDSIFNDEKSKEIGALETRYELEKQKEIKEREEEKARQIAKEAQFRSNMIQFTLSFLGIIAFLFLVVWLVKLRLSVQWATRLLLFGFLMFFELTLLIIEPQIIHFTKQNILGIFFLNSLVAGIFFPLHKIIEKRINKYLGKMKVPSSKTQEPSPMSQGATGSYIKKDNMSMFILMYLSLSVVPLLLPHSFVSSQTSTLSQTEVKASNSDTISSFVKTQTRDVTSQIDSLKHLLVNSKDDTNKIQLLLQIGIASYHSKESLPYYQQALELSQKIKNTKLEADCYNDIGLVQQNLSNYPLALGNFLKSLRIKDSLGLENSKNYAGNLNNIGLVYRMQGEYNRALEYYLRGIRIYESIGMENSLEYASCLNNIGSAYRTQGMYDRALEHYLKSISIKKSLGVENSKEYANSLNNIGIVYYYQNKKDSVLNFFIKSLEIKEKIEDKAGVASSLNNIGKLYAELASVEKTSAGRQIKYVQALDYLKKGYDLSKAIRDTYGVMLTSENLAKTYTQLNKYKDAFGYHQIFSTFKDSIFNKEKNKEIGALETKYEWEKQERQKKYEQEKQAKITDEQKKRNDLLTVSGVFIIIVTFFLGLLLYVSNLPFNFHFVEGLLFVVFFMFFELVLVFLDPYIDGIAGNMAMLKLLCNSIIAAGLSPLHEVLEGRMKGKIKRNRRRRGGSGKACLERKILERKMKI